MRRRHHFAQYSFGTFCFGVLLGVQHGCGGSSANCVCLDFCVVPMRCGLAAAYVCCPFMSPLPRVVVCVGPMASVRFACSRHARLAFLPLATLPSAVLESMEVQLSKGVAKGRVSLYAPCIGMVTAAGCQLARNLTGGEMLQ